ncbi:MAG: NUDIX hydrolase [Pseudomonadota bacterium]
MTAPPRFCARCGAPLTTRELEDRPRQVCPSCGMVHYRNPLPVASALVLDDERRVLLVRRAREPHRGAWCLPMGFAELGETIADAALRELEEEAGVRGHVRRLLDADSQESDFYGDLLVVTFEVEIEEGEPRAGDDAAEVAWFPVAAPPPLAFPSNERALIRCRRLHGEAWAIQDSFAELPNGGAFLGVRQGISAEARQGLGQALLSDALVTLVREQASRIAGLWLQEVRTNSSTPGYAGMAPGALLGRATTALGQFGRWLQSEESADEIRDFYYEVGRERRAAGIPLHEVLSSLSLLRKHVWTFARGQGVWSRPIDVYRVLELDRRIALFFDRAAYHTARGWEDAP